MSVFIHIRSRWLLAALFLCLLVPSLGRSQETAELIRQGNDLLGEQQPGQALARFQQALAQDAGNLDALRGAGRVHEWLGQWPEAIEAFQRVGDAETGDVETWFALGRINSWAGNLDRSHVAYRQALSHAPDRKDIQLAYAEALSWHPERRREAIALYERILSRTPNSIPARAGLAQSLAWSGEISRARDTYNTVLREDTENIVALVGLAEIARWNMELERAGQLIAAAERSASGDPRVLVARAELDTAAEMYASARRGARLLISTDPEAALRFEQQIDRNTRPSYQAGFQLRRDQKVSAPNRLNYNSYSSQISFATSAQSRLTVFYDLPFYHGAGSTNGNLSGLRWQFRPNLRARGLLEARTEASPGRPNRASGRARFQLQANDWARIAFELDRRLVDDSLHSIRGSSINGASAGPAYSNIASMQTSFRLIPAAMDFYWNMGGGFYEGVQLDRNWKTQIDLGLGKMIRNSQPAVRVGYGFTLFQFSQDQSFLPEDAAPLNRTGGYFSPDLFTNQFGIIGLTGQFAGTGEWLLEGTLGVQQFRPRFDQVAAQSRHPPVVFF